jgi:hypothetical protein
MTSTLSSSYAKTYITQSLANPWPDSTSTPRIYADNIDGRTNVTGLKYLGLGATSGHNRQHREERRHRRRGESSWPTYSCLMIVWHWTFDVNNMKAPSESVMSDDVLHSPHTEKCAPNADKALFMHSSSPSALSSQTMCQGSNSDMAIAPPFPSPLMENSTKDNVCNVTVLVRPQHSWSLVFNHACICRVWHRRTPHLIVIPLEWLLFYHNP